MACCSFRNLHPSHTNTQATNISCAMRFYYVALAVAATLIASINAVSVEADNRIFQTASDTIATTHIESPVKRSLRAHKPAYDEEDSLDSLDDMEERVKGIDAEKLKQIIPAKRVEIPTSIANLNPKAQQNLVDKLRSQDLSQKEFATKLGLRDVDDTNHVNSAFFNAWKNDFRVGKKPKKVPEMLIGNHEYYP